MQLRVTFRDADGMTVETFTCPDEEALERIGAFVESHGTDPCGDGAGASAGSVEFAPVKS